MFDIISQFKLEQFKANRVNDLAVVWFVGTHFRPTRNFSY